MLRGRAAIVVILLALSVATTGFGANKGDRPARKRGWYLPSKASIAELVETNRDLATRNAISYLANETGQLTLRQRASVWKAFARDIKARFSMWESIGPYRTDDGGLYFRGIGGYALVIRKDGKLFKGWVSNLPLLPERDLWHPPYDDGTLFEVPVRKESER